MSERGAPERHFLGWGRPLLDAAAEWLCAQRGAELGDLHVALSSSRAARGLAARIARRRAPSEAPPRVLTIGALSDRLLRLDAPTASRWTRTAAWARALASLSENELRPLVPRPPAPRDLVGWMRLAETVRALFGELAAERRDFAEAARLVELPGEAARWRALARAERHVQELLAQAGLADPHLARLGALRRGAVDERARVVLVGVVDPNGLQRGLLEALGERVAALVFAPAELAERFDAFGVPIPDAWREREIALPLDRWRIADRPEDQAREAARALAEAPRRFAAHEVSIGLPRAELAPFLERRFAESGIALRDAAGTPLVQSAPARLLAAAARALDGWRSAEHAELVRHPDLERALALDGEPLALLDVYRREHVPSRVGAEWLGIDERDRERSLALTAAHERLLALLGELASEDTRPLGAWADPMRAFLVAVYDAVELDRPEERALAAALACIGEKLAELERVPAALAPDCDAHRALEVFARSLRGERVPPPPFDPERPTIELLGWLELLYDPAPALVLTGFEEGGVPDSVSGDAFLPDGLRGALGLPDDARRCARDAYALEAILASREHAVLVTGRRGAQNDPLSPSRLAFQCAPERAVERVRHVLRASESFAHPTEGAPESAPRRELPRRSPAPAPQVWRVTAFAEYLRSPYLFYLRHVLRVDTVDDGAREMDGGVFGELAHDVLQRFGASELRDASDPESIADYLSGALARCARARFGDAPGPAVGLQIEQLGWRLRRFAKHQARRAAEGWRIAHVEWEPSTRQVPFEVDGEPIRLAGRIDRIDRHPQHGYAIYDYKTGDGKTLGPKAALARDGSWRDLQLPLYCMLAAELDMGDLPAVGYALLGKDDASIGFANLSPWDEERLEAALETARDVVRRVRRGELFEAGDPVALEPVLRALFGHGLLEPEGEADEGDEAGEDAA